MSNITAVAEQFFEACETGKGWEGCHAYCTPMQASRPKPSRWRTFGPSRDTLIG
jgi:hypothetical protein